MNALVVGASRGLGAAVAQGISHSSSTVFVVSRSRPIYVGDDSLGKYTWIETDLSNPVQSSSDILAGLGGKPLDLVVYCAGIWERADYLASTDEELLKIVNVNLAAPLILFKRIMPSILSASSPLIVLIGSTCGLENEGSTSVAYTASKFGLRGLAYSLREIGRSAGTRVTCISPGSMASDVSLERGTEFALRRHNGKRIPVGDVVAIISNLFSLSPASCVKDIILPATLDTDV